MALARIGFNAETCAMIEIAVEKPARSAADGARWLPTLKAAVLEAASRASTLVVSMGGERLPDEFLAASFGALRADPAITGHVVDWTLALRADRDEPVAGAGGEAVEAALRIMEGAGTRRT